MAHNRLLLYIGIAFLILPAASCKPACPIASCQVRMVHRHEGGREYRGQPIYKKQNPKMGEKLPKQKGESAAKRKN